MQRELIGGIAILAMILLCIIGELVRVAVAASAGLDDTAWYALVRFVAGMCALVAIVALLPTVRISTKIQVGGLLLVGIASVLIARHYGGEINWMSLLSRNTLLLSMIIAVGFLKLTIDGQALGAGIETGPRAFRHTLLVIALFGSVINISAPLVVGDRLVRRRPMTLFTARNITRMFSACAAWSPYFAGMAVVLVYVDDTPLGNVMLAGLPFMLCAAVVIYLLAVHFSRQDVTDFEGFPINAASLGVPLLLSMMVVLLFHWVPSLSILASISLSAIVLTIILLWFRMPPAQVARKLGGHVRSGLPRSINELLLFMTAGVMATGLSATVSSGLITLPPMAFSGTTASMLLVAMIAVAAIGIHPVIQISAFTPLVMPAEPSPTLLATTYLFAWSLGTCVSPLSGTHLVFQGRYGIPAWQGAAQNLPYAAIMLVVGSAILMIISRLGI